MGLPIWSSVGYGNEENKTKSKAEALAPARSPIQRHSSTRTGSIVNPESGEVRSFRRPMHARRVIPPPVPVAQSQSQESTYHPPIRSPLVPSMGPIGNVIARAQRVLGLAHLEMDNLLQRQYFPRPAIASARPLLSHHTLNDELDCLLRAAREFSETTREQITHLIRWERNVLRGEVSGTGLPAEFQSELEALIQECEVAMRNIKSRLEGFESWPSDARATPSTSATSRRLRSTDVPRSVRYNASQVDFNDVRRRAYEMRESQAILQRQREPRPRLERPSLIPPVPRLILPNGLGDRTRSASPENDGEAWDTMRMTLEPDDRLPSADSSFTTAAASASFSTPSDGSNSAPLSASTSRTSLTDSLVMEEDCGPEDDNQPATGSLLDYHLPEVLPSPLFRDMESSGTANRRAGPRTNWLDSRNELRAPLLPGRSYNRNVDLPSPGQSGSRSPGGNYMFPAPRSQSPLSYVSNNGVSTGPSSAFGALDEIITREGPLSATRTGQDQSSREHSQPLSPNNDVLRLALRYAAAVAPSSDPHADPELEHLRRMFSTVASRDGHLDEDWWMSAGVAPYLADEASPTDHDLHD